MTQAARVLEALDTVYDPELDEPVTTLGFVASCTVADGGDVEVRLRLPTHQCAPNFAYLMVADARDAVAGVPGVGEVRILLEDHMTAEEINGAVLRREGFSGAFPGETTGELDELRLLFQRKALVARESRVLDALLSAGADPAAIAGLRLGELPRARSPSAASPCAACWASTQTPARRPSSGRTASRSRRGTWPAGSGWRG